MRTFAGLIKSIITSLNNTKPTQLAFGLNNAAGNFVHDMANGRLQSFFLSGGVPGETVIIELLQSNETHTNYLKAHNCGEKAFDNNGQIEMHTSCSVPDHAGDQDIYQVTWRGVEYIYTISYIDNR